MSIRFRLTLLIALLALCSAVLAAPVPAHAADSPVGEVLVSFGADFIGEIMDVVISMLGVADQTIGKVISWGGQAISAAIGMEINYGGAAVYQVWKIFRDICNGLFIVLFIFVAFGTIFNVVWKNPFYYQSALKNVIIAALLINFSLPVGQIIIWAGNKATALVNSTMGEVDVAATILSRGKLPQVMVGHNNSLTISQIPMTNVPDAKLNPVQKLAKQELGEVHDARLQECRDSGKYDLAECIARVARIEAAEAQQKYEQATLEPGLGAAIKRTLSDTVLFWGNAAKGAARGAVGGVTGGVTGVIIGAAEGGWSGASFTPPTEDPALDVNGKGLLILSKMVNLFFKGVIALSFLVVVIFMFARLPVVWFYLAMSALAFFSIGVPGTNTYKDWLKNMIGWNIFAPLYLFVIYIGMMVLNNDTALLDGLSGAGAFAGIVGMALFYVLAGGIFLIGAKMAWGYAFRMSSSLETQVTKYADMFGVGEKSNFGASTLASKLGITAQYKARKAQVQQIGGDIAAGIKGRAPTLFRSEAESEAYRKMKLGVRGAGAELDKLTAKRVGTQKEMLEARGLDAAGLRKVLNSGNRDAAMAAGEILLKKGELKSQERERLLGLYGGVSPVARKEAQKRITEQLQKQSGREWKSYLDDTGSFDFNKFVAAVEQTGKSSEERRKFIENAIKGEVGQRFALDSAQLGKVAELMDNPEDQRAFFEAASKSGRNKVAAIETMANLGLIFDRNGQPVKTDVALSDRADSLSPTDLLDAEAYFMRAGRSMPGAVKEKFDSSLLKDRNKSAQMLRNATPEQMERLYQDLAQEGRRVYNVEQQMSAATQSEKRLGKATNRLQQKLKQTKDRSLRSKIQKKIDQIQDRRDSLKESAAKLKKTV